MNRIELIEDIAKRSGISKRQTRKIIEAYEEAVIDAVSIGEQIYLHGFMIIDRKTVKACQKHKFGTNEKITVPEKDYVKIRPGSKLAGCVK